MKINYSTFMLLVNTIKAEVAPDAKVFRKDDVSAEKRSCYGIILLKRSEFLSNDSKYFWNCKIYTF